MTECEFDVIMRSWKGRPPRSCMPAAGWRPEFEWKFVTVSESESDVNVIFQKEGLKTMRREGCSARAGRKLAIDSRGEGLDFASVGKRPRASDVTLIS